MNTELSSTAYHEAGHSVITYRLGFETRQVTIKPDDDSGTAGYSCGEDPWIDGSRDADFIINLFAGYTAEKRHNPGAEESRSSSDNERAAERLQLHPELSEQDLWQKTGELVVQYWPEIEAVAAALMRDTTLSGEEIEIICDAIDEDEDWQEVLSKYRERQKLFLDDRV